MNLSPVSAHCTVRSILLGALLLRLPPDWATLALALLARPENLVLAALGAIGLVALIEMLLLLPATPTAPNSVLQAALFPGMPLAVGMAGTAEEQGA